MFSKIQIDKISISSTIAVVALSIALIMSIVYGLSNEVTLTIAGTLGGYIGGRASALSPNTTTATKEK